MQFYKELQEKFPTLTSNEMKLCAFLGLNMSTKDPMETLKNLLNVKGGDRRNSHPLHIPKTHQEFFGTEHIE